MSSTNHTANYNLPQFVGTDKPAWLGDINPAMSGIDTQMKANADGVAGILSMLNLTTNSTKQASELISVAGLTATGALRVSQNSDGSIFKFYNFINITNNTDSTVNIPLTAVPGLSGVYGLKVLSLNYAPSEAYTILSAGTYVWKDNENQQLLDVESTNISVGTDGYVYILTGTQNVWGMAPYRGLRAYFPPCVYFNKSFGD